MKPERQGARNAKGGENIPRGGSGVSKDTELGKGLLFSGTGRSARLLKRAEECETPNQ